MRKFRFSFLIYSAIVFSIALFSCKNDSYLRDSPPIPDQSFVEEFDTMQNAFNRGWRWINRSTPIGVTNWGPGPGTATMLAYSSKGTNTGLAYSDYLSTAGTNNGTISNWLISPQIMMQNGDKIVFYTKSELFATAGTDFGARLQLAFNKDGDLTVGDGDNAGKFENVMLDINPDEESYFASAPSPTAYPIDWTRFEGTVSGLSNPVKGRFAFRYFLHDAGSNGQGNAIGIDSVAYIGKH
ncbi:MAG: choice-of-anchor J domain-containing protein [Flavisolibacter sp.]